MPPYIADFKFPIPSKKKMPVGSIFFIKGRPYRRGPKGMIYSAVHGASDPTIQRAAFRRMAKLQRRK